MALGGSGGMLPQEIFEKKKACSEINSGAFLALHYMYNISVSGLIYIIYNIYIYIYTLYLKIWGSERLPGGGGGGGKCPLHPPPPPPPPPNAILNVHCTQKVFQN